MNEKIWSMLDSMKVKMIKLSDSIVLVGLCSITKPIKSNCSSLGLIKFDYQTVRLATP